MGAGFTKGKGKNRKFIPISNSKKDNNEIIVPKSNPEKTHYHFSNSDYDRSFKLEQRRLLKKQSEINAEIAKLKQEQFNLLKSKKIRQNDYERRNHIEKVKTGVKATSLVISSFEPHFAGIYLSYKFAKFGYDFTKKFLANYRITDSWDKALLNTVDDEIRNTVLTLLQSNKFKKVTEIVTRNLYEKFLSTINVNIDSKYDLLIKRSMSYSINNIIFNNSSKEIMETDFTNRILENYVQNMFIENSPLDKEFVFSSEFQKKLSEKILLDLATGKIDENLCLTNAFSGTDWVEENVPDILDLII